MSSDSQIQLLAAISKVQSAFINNANTVAAFDQMLNTLLELTTSEYGFVGEALTSEAGELFLKIRATSNVAWNQDILNFPTGYDPTAEFQDPNTLFGHLITNGFPVISTYQTQDPCPQESPKGQPLLRTLLRIPLRFGGHVIGMVGVANRPGGYDETVVTALSPFLDTCAALLKSFSRSEQTDWIGRQPRSYTGHLPMDLNNIADSVLTMDADGVIGTFNQSAEQLFGYTASEVIGRNLQTLFPDQYGLKLKRDLQIAVHEASPSPVIIKPRLTGQRKDGSFLQAELSLAKCYENERIVFIGVIRNQTECRQTQLSLHQSEKPLREGQALARLGSLTWDLHSDAQKWSDELYQMFGYHPGAIAPTLEALKRTIHPEDEAHAISRIETGIKLHDRFEMEFRIVRPDGQVRHVHGQAVIDRAPSQTALGMRATFFDITTERSAIQSHKILTYAIDHSMEGLALLDREGRYMYMNPAHASLYGFSVQELIGKTWRELYSLREIHHIEHNIFPQLTQNGSWAGELLGRRKSGETFDAEISLCLLAGPMASGQEFLVCSCRDITARKQIEAALKLHSEALEVRVRDRTAELAAANSRLRRLSKALIRSQEHERRRIASDLHDEIGQALTALNINLQVLRENHRGHHRFEESLELSGSILAQVRELAVNLRPQLLDEFGIAEAVRIYAERQAERNGWALTFELSGEWNTCTDETAVTCFRIIQESLTNTARHAKADLVTVSLAFLECTVNVAVEDNGVGFDLQMAFSKERVHGTGLTGMRERVDLAGGRLTLTTSPGHGTRIRAEIPYVKD